MAYFPVLGSKIDVA